MTAMTIRQQSGIASEYSLGTPESSLRADLITLGGASYGVLHWEVFKAYGSKWHAVAAVIEHIPVLGGVVALIECIAIKIFFGDSPILKDSMRNTATVKYRVSHCPLNPDKRLQTDLCNAGVRMRSNSRWTVLPGLYLQEACVVNKYLKEQRTSYHVNPLEALALKSSKPIRLELRSL